MSAVQPIAESAEFFAGELLSALLRAVNDLVVVLDRRGIIACANDSWIQSAIENGASEVSGFGVGSDYLGICRRAAAAGVAEAQAAADGIEAVLAGAAESFIAEYACSFEDVTRYFRCIVLPVSSPAPGAVVAHIEITHSRQAARLRERRSRLARLQQEVTAAANEASTFEAALKRTLQPICSAFGWQAAHAFYLLERELILLPTNLWHFQTKDGLARLASVRADPLDFNPATEKVAVRSLQSSAAPRANLARELGLSHIVNVTVPVGPHPGGLLEFFSAVGTSLEEDEREVLINVAAHLGRVLERERHTSALLRSEAKFRGIFESNTVPMYFWNADKKVLDCNDAFLRLVGFTREEIERGELNCAEITPEDQQHRDTEVIERLRRTGHSDPYEKNWVRRDGKVLNVILGGALLPGSNDVGMAVATDVTELRRATTALRESERRYKLATSAAAISIWELDIASDVVFSDGVLSELLGYPPDERVPHQTWIDRIHAGDRERVLRHERSVLENADRLPDGSTPIPEIEFRVRHRNRSVRWVVNRGLVLRDGADQPYRAIGAITDITEQKRAQNALRKSQLLLGVAYRQVQSLTGRLIAAQEEERRRVAREIHDDLGQRLAVLGLALANIRRRITGSDDLFAAAEKQVDELTVSVRDISHNLHSAVLEHAGLAAALRSLAEEFRGMGPLQVSLNLPPFPENIPEQTSLAAYRIVQEALRNIHKHSGAGNARINVIASSTNLLIRVSDDGCGFNTFAPSDKRGLGLISAKERARLAGGRLWIVSSPGKGTGINAVLPLQEGVHHEAA